MSGEIPRIDILLYIALSEEFDAAMEMLGNGFKSRELSGIALTGFFGSISSPILGRDFQVAAFPAGKMGTTRSANITSAIIEKLQPADVVVLGIAGSLTNDLEPGDVFIPDSVNEYLANSASRGEEESWTFDTSGNHFQTSVRLLNRFQFFHHTQRTHHTAWLEDAFRRRAELILQPTQDAINAAGLLMRGECKLYVGDDRKLASGPAVGKGKAFLEWLRRGVDRKVAAIEMESAGVYDAAIIRTPAPRTIAIRGISDYADARKEKIETSAKGLFRELAAKNALSLFIRGIEAGLFQPDSANLIGTLPSAPATTPESQVKSDFVLESSQMKQRIQVLRKDSDAQVSQPLPEIGSFGDFIGRERQLLEVEERLQTNPLVTVVGPGGIGKTRLALEIFKRRKGGATRDTEMAFISFESMTDNSEGAVLDAMVSGLRLIPGDAGGLRGALLKRFRAASLMLVLDNCETARSSIASIVRDLLNQCPNLKILATSQHQLGLTGGLEAVYELPPLSVPDERAASLDALQTLESYELFVTRAQMAADSWIPEKDSLSSLRRLLQLTDGIPLAIEIVAAWAPTVSLAQICEDLDQTPFARVTGFDEYSSVASERHRSMLRCLEWSFTHLSKTSPKEAEGFKRLGVFAGRFTEDAVGEICEVEAPRELLVRLVKMSLVYSCPGTEPRRYSMLRFTRAFAQQKAQALGIEQRLIERHVDFFFRLASPSNDEGEWKPEPLASFEHEWLDIVAAANAAPLVGNLQAVWRISRALGPFLLKHGLWSERERLNRASVKAASDANYWAALERSLIDLGIILEAQGLWEKAAEQFRRSLYFANRNITPNPSHQAMALQRLGAVLTRMGDVAGAERASRKLSEITPLLDQPKAKARSLDEEGKMLQGRGDLVNAALKYREAFQIRESIGDENGMARSRMNFGANFTLRGVWDAAEEALRRSLDFWDSERVAREQGIILHLLADLFRRQGRYPEARDFCDRSLKCREDDPKGRAVTLALLARILRIQRDFEKSVVVSEQGRELCRSIGDAEGESIALDDIGTAYASQRQWDEALTAFNESLRLKESGTRRDIVGLAITLDRIAQIHARRGHWGQAEASYIKSLKCSEEAGREITAAITLMNVAMMHAAQGQKQSAITILDDAIGSLGTQQAGKAVLFEARKLRAQLDRKMREGFPWLHWRDAAFKNQQLFVRKRFDHERRAKQWKEAAIGYDVLTKEFIESGQQMEAGLALNELAGAYRHLGEFVRSEDAVRQALAIFEEITLPLGQAASWHKLGDLYADQHRWQEAASAYDESIKIKVECFDDDGEAISQDALALVLINVGQFVEAERAANRAWEIFSESGSPWQKWHPLVRIFWLKVEQGNFADAKTVAVCLAQAVQGNRELETAASELRAMAEAGDWDGVKARLTHAGITGPVEITAPEPAVQEPRKASAASCSLRRRGQGWDICFRGDGPFQLKNTVGIQYLATLLGSPDESIHCSILASSKGRAAVSSSLTAENTPILTPEAKRAYRVKLAELKEQIATAESRGLVDEVVDLKEEAEEIDAALGAAHDKLGDDQSLTDDGNKIRNAVCNPIRRVMTCLRDDSQTREIGRHLLDQVSLGFNCVYPKNKEKGLPWAVEQ